MVNEDDTYKNISPEDAKRLKDEVLKLRELKRSGARPSNRATAQDVRFTVENITSEVCYHLVLHREADKFKSSA